MNFENIFVDLNLHNDKKIQNSHRIISFDVGIKNLAYCIIDVNIDIDTGTKSGIYIVDWSIINLTGDDTTPLTHHTCSCISNSRKGNNMCGKTAKYKRDVSFFCDAHAKKSTEWIIPSRIYSPTTLKTRNIAQLTSIAEDLKLTLIQTKPTKGKLMELIILEIKRRELIHLVAKKTSNTRDVDLITIGRNIKTFLDRIPLIKTVSGVLIENQIGPLALRMKSVQGLLSQYFIMRFDAIPIFFISSSNKLKNLPSISTTIVPDSEDDETQGKKYKKHKSDAIIHATHIINSNPTFKEWTSLFSRNDSTANKKKDDYADCFLQALWWLVSSNIVCAEEYIYKVIIN